MGLGGHLASVHSAQEQTFVSDLRPDKKQPVWLGGSDSAEENKWVWTDGTKFEYTNWVPGEPNDGGNEDCLEVGHMWNDRSCNNYMYKFICKKQFS